MKKHITKVLACLSLVGIMACETTELDLLENPTQVSQDQLDPQNLFDNIQLSFRGFVSSTAGYSSFSSEVTSQFAMTGSSIYAGAYSPTSFNGIWSTAYAGILQDINALENVANPENYEYHIGVSKIMKAYVLFTLVDLFGDVPYEEALMGQANLNPSLSDQVLVYQAALAELAAGRTLMQSPQGTEPLNDFYYGDDAAASWVTAANSIELRTLNNARMAASELGIDIPARITALLNENNLIDTPGEDLQFNYYANRLNPDSRHPGYSLNYENSPSGYIANYLMWEMTGEKGFDDPRLRYYFYRQDTDATDEDIFTLGCAAQSAPGHYAALSSIYSGTALPFCTAVPDRGFWGRDHGNDDGIPPDGLKRTVWGAYPAGGLFDAEQGESVQNEGEDGLLGAGIEPILMSSHIAFIKAEIALVMGIGNAEAALEDGMRFSIDKVVNFGSLDPLRVIVPDDPETEDVNEEVLQGQFFPTPSYINSYITFVLNAFAAADADDKLDIVMKEHHIASFGNGMEVYNAYRRTGFPSNMQPSLNQNPGDFYRSALYPANSVNNNVNINQAEISRQVFWDKNPAGFIN
jgi:hypothetical protein